MSERTGWLSDAEVLAAQTLDASTPYAICGISHGMFSVARHYGGMTYQGKRYVYFPEHDECVRADVVAMAQKMRRKARQTRDTGNKRAQGALL